MAFSPARILTGAVVLSLLANGLAVGTASAASGPDIRSTVTVPSGTYLAGDPLTVKLTVTNVGDQGAYYLRKHERAISGTGFHIENMADWGDLGPTGLGASYLPGQTREYTLRGRLGQFNGDAHFALGPLSPRDVNPADDQGTALVRVVPAETKVSVSGQVYGDADRSGSPTPGEGLAGATMALRVQDELAVRTAVTDAEGRYTFPEVPVGTHGLSTASLPDGWVSNFSTALRLDGSVPDTVVPVRALRPLSESLQAKLTLDKASYPAGSEGEVTVTLTNISARPLTGVTIACDRGDNGLALDISDQAWGELAHDAGTTVQPGQTREYRARGAVRPKSAGRGFVHQACDFSQGEEYNDGEPSGDPQAKVTGLDGSATGELFQDANGNGSPDPGEGLADRELRLTDVHNGHEFTARTDAAGKSRVTGPTGRYRLTSPGCDLGQDKLIDVTTPDFDINQWFAACRPAPVR
ncbi:carboxypeptidase-like regulatory domain-containing protein [Crossiella sp. SN42]|uniref:carboxypeptidase-like regulatory domain-containing protein n=1 Tax=Crossiella sp. SN42 TaxID=2944808 RepID=UPI00207D59CF|nr:carboxypeptidase-like regulatory domain-containing protein [Crossiella sp. SN42]MCO1580298.1 carboxypeptidase-like regulatory domain-containing protein [Crossiella sp. SN42]